MPNRRRGRGFAQAGGFLGNQMRKAGAKRGFAQTRLLTNWAEVVGPAVANLAHPVKISFNRSGLGATLTLLTNGATAPMLQMQTPQIIERVNACYGYSAVSRIKITQTSATGFAETARAFVGESLAKKTKISPEMEVAVETTVKDVDDTDLRKALKTLGQNVAASNNFHR